MNFSTETSHTECFLPFFSVFFFFQCYTEKYSTKICFRNVEIWTNSINKKKCRNGNEAQANNLTFQTSDALTDEQHFLSTIHYFCSNAHLSDEFFHTKNLLITIFGSRLSCLIRNHTIMWNSIGLH